MTKALFMDIDGVLNSDSWNRRRGERRPEHGEPGSVMYFAKRCFDPAAMVLMNEVVARTGTMVVLSSSWRDDGLQKCQRILKLAGATFDLFDRTPSCAQKVGELYIGQERGAEIKEWLDAHSEIDRFAIVDDGNDMGALLQYLVKTDPGKGLTRVEARLLIHMLGEEDAAGGVQVR